MEGCVNCIKTIDGPQGEMSVNLCEMIGASVCNECGIKFPANIV